MAVIELSDELAAMLKARAAAQGQELEDWLSQLASDSLLFSQREKPASIREEMATIRAHVKPDPDDWTTQDYVRYGRR